MSARRSLNTKAVRGKHAAPPTSERTPMPRRSQDAPSTGGAEPQHTPAPTRASRRTVRPEGSQKRRVPLGLKVVLAVLLVVVLVGGSFLIWNYLFRYDDAKDIQGQWKIEGSNASIVITDSEIRLTDTVSFGYELNTFEKAITYTYENFSGKGTYVFSPERDVLTLTDVAEASNGDGSDPTVHLLKVSNSVVGEPETADDNDTADADPSGADATDGSTPADRSEPGSGTQNSADPGRE